MKNRNVMVLNEKIIQKMKSRNLSISALEKRAGLKIHAVRNVLKGRVKKPRFTFLLAIAEALDCSPLDFMTSSSLSEPSEWKESTLNKKRTPLNHPDLMIGCANAIASLLEEKELTFSVSHYLEVVKIVYCYSLTAEPKVPDIKFAKWLLENEYILPRKL